MPTVYKPKLDKFSFYEVFTFNDSSIYPLLTVTSDRFIEKLNSRSLHHLLLDNKLNYPTVIRKIKEAGFDYETVFIDENTFIQSNLKYPTSLMQKYPSGESCKKAFKKINIKKESTFLVAQDDGSKVYIPSVYYALKSLMLIKFCSFNSTKFTQNYLSISDSKLSRSRFTFNYLDYYIDKKVDYVISTGFKDVKKTDQILEKGLRETNEGVIIYTRLTTKFYKRPNILIKVGEDFGFFCFLKASKSYKIYQIKKEPSSRGELMAFLQQSLR